MIHVFCGYDDREAIGYHVFCASLIARASRPVSHIALSSRGMPAGTNAFTLSRFLVPFLMGYRGHGIFMDASDMFLNEDIARLDSKFNSKYAVQVVKHPDYETRHARKYVGTPMEADNRNYSRKNWASVMLFNCAHPAWRQVNPETLPLFEPLQLLQFQHLQDKQIGELPDAWNRLVDEGHPVSGANLLHWTAGVPAFDHYKDAPGSALWHAQRELCLG